MSYEKPKGLLKDMQQQRIRKKSPWLRRLEEQQAKAREAAERAEEEKRTKRRRRKAPVAENVTQFHRKGGER